MEKKLKYLKKLDLLKLALEGLCTLKAISDLTKRKPRSCSVREINRDRKVNGFFAQHFLKIKDIDLQQFFSYTRMEPRIYKLLLNLVTPFLMKNSIRESVQPECRLALTLLYLSQGNSFHSLATSFKLGKETVRCIILETTEVLWSKLSLDYVAEPSVEAYKQIAEDFYLSWDMPNCIGCIDGKHIAIKSPNKGDQSGDYKEVSSVVLLAACDARYRFTLVDVGAYGSRRDGGIFQMSRLGKRLLNNELPIPPPKRLPNSELHIPYYFVGNTAFPLAVNLMRPFPGEVLPEDRETFNKKLSMTHRVIENAFGILFSRWRVLLTTPHLFPNNAAKIVLSCVALHNFIMHNDDNALYMPSRYTDWEDSNGEVHAGSWRTDVGRNIPSITTSSNLHHYGGKASTKIRTLLCSFFNDL